MAKLVFGLQQSSDGYAGDVSAHCENIRQLLIHICEIIYAQFPTKLTARRYQKHRFALAGHFKPLHGARF